MLVPLTPPPTTTTSAVCTITVSLGPGPRPSRSISAAELGVVPARDLLGHDLERDALRRARRRRARERRAPGLLCRDVADDGLDESRVLDNLAMPADHHRAELGVLTPGLDHHPDPGISADIEHLLRLGVRGHIDGAIPGEKAHRHD